MESPSYPEVGQLKCQACIFIEETCMTFANIYSRTFVLWIS